MAALRNLATSLIKICVSSNVAEGNRTLIMNLPHLRTGKDTHPRHADAVWRAPTPAAMVHSSRCG